MDVYARNLRRRARELGLSDAEIARRAGLTERRYGHYVAGTREPDLATLVRICEVLAATPNDLLLATPEAAGELTQRERGVAQINAAVAVLDDERVSLAADLVQAVAAHRGHQRSE
jgi:transcriptional regulator with XRE-family HTH domain